jgi:hypothetical protein
VQRHDFDDFIVVNNPLLTLNVNKFSDIRVIIDKNKIVGRVSQIMSCARAKYSKIVVK